MDLLRINHAQTLKSSFLIKWSIYLTNDVKDLVDPAYNKVFDSMSHKKLIVFDWAKNITSFWHCILGSLMTDWSMSQESNQDDKRLEGKD